MKRILAFTVSCLLIASAGYSFQSATMCSDAFGNLKMVKEKREDHRTTNWFLNGNQYDDDDVKASIDKDDAVLLIGDEYNGYFTTTGKFKGAGEKIKNRRMLCQSVDVVRTKTLPPDMQPEFVPAVFTATANCSSASGKTQRVSDGMTVYWTYNGMMVDNESLITMNPSIQIPVGENNYVYEVVFKFQEQEESVPEFVMCN